MRDRALHTIQKYALLKQGDRIVVGVSGGADSVALLHFLCDLQKDWGLTIIACHLNHLLRGEESERDEQFVRSLCDTLSVELLVRRVEVAQYAKEQGLSTELAGREVRYAFFEEVCGKEQGKIATAHTLSDAVETLLFHMARGTALSGLCGIPPKRGQIIRPLIDCTRVQIEEYCKEHGLSYVTDSTNLSDAYTRNRIRHHLVPLLEEMNPSAQLAMGRMLESLREDDNLLDTLAIRAFEVGDSPKGVPRENYLQADKAIQKRILSLLLTQNGIAVNFERIEQMATLADSGSGQMQLNADFYFRVTDSHLTLVKTQEEEPYFEQKIPVQILREGGKIPLNTVYKAALSVQNQKYCEFLEKNPQTILKNAVDCDKINGTVIFRQREIGDRITLAKRNCTKTLKKLFNEMHFTGREKSLTTVMCDESGVVWVQGVGVDRRCAPDEQTSRFLSIQIDFLEDKGQ